MGWCMTSLIVHSFLLPFVLHCNFSTCCECSSDIKQFLGTLGHPKSTLTTGVEKWDFFSPTATIISLWLIIFLVPQRLRPKWKVTFFKLAIIEQLFCICPDQSSKRALLINNCHFGATVKHNVWIRAKSDAQNILHMIHFSQGYISYGGGCNLSPGQSTAPKRGFTPAISTINCGISVNVQIGPN